MSYFVDIPFPENETYVIKEHIDSGQDYPYHYHPEYELNLVMKSFGERFVGDSIQKYGKGDLVLTGPNLPHQWQKDISFKGKNALKDHIYVMQFKEEFFGVEFFGRKEMELVVELFERAKRGVCFGIETSQKIQPLMATLIKKKGLQGIMVLLEIIDLLSKTNEYTLLASPGFISQQDVKGRTKITGIVRFILDNFNNEISAKQAAELAGMNLSAFSHYFKNRTTKSFVRFLNEVRLGHASRLLLESDLSVLEICYQSGFGNLSNFNRQFKNHYNTSPLKYRKLH